MINDQYFPLEANLADDDRLCLLIEQMGMEGMGIYLTLLMELRRRENYILNMKTLPRIARNMCSDLDKVLQVITSFNLFQMDGDLETGAISSPYLDRVMKRLEEKREKRRQAGLKGYQVAKRGVNGCFTADGGTEEKSKEEESREEDSKQKNSTAEADNNIPAADDEVDKLSPLKPWETYIDQAIGEQSWVEIIAKQSGMGMDFIRYLPFITQLFKEHALTQGKEGSILSLCDAKSYFANYIRDGTPTNKRVRGLLDKEKKRRETENPYRYEDLDVATGIRSFCGIPIPPGAPPRPGPNSMWNEVGGVWEG